MTLNNIRLSEADKQKLIKKHMGQSITGPGSSNGGVDINYKEAISNINIDLKSADPFNSNWVIRNNQEIPGMTVYKSQTPRDTTNQQDEEVEAIS